MKTDEWCSNVTLKLSRWFCFILMLRSIGNDENSSYVKLSKNYFSSLKQNQPFQVKYGTETHNQNLKHAWRTLYYPGNRKYTAQEESPPSIPMFMIAIIAGRRNCLILWIERQQGWGFCVWNCAQHIITTV